jgi:hypothetical protein
MNEIESTILKNQLAILNYLCDQSISEMSNLNFNNDFRKNLMKDNHELVDAYKRTKEILNK